MKRLLFIGASLVIIALTIFAIYQSGFFVTSKTSGKIGSIEPVFISFNQRPDSGLVKKFRIEPQVAGTTEVQDESIVFTPRDGFVIGTKYTYRLDSPRSLRGKTISSVTGEFEVIYKDFNKLSSKSQKNLKNQSSSFEKSFPIVQILPYETLNYKIVYRPPSSGGKLILTITTYGIINRPDQQEEYKRQTLEYRQQALDYIKSRGYRPEDYIIEYDPADI